MFTCCYVAHNPSRALTTCVLKRKVYLNALEVILAHFLDLVLFLPAGSFT
jgi:hypothetical protein